MLTQEEINFVKKLYALNQTEIALKNKMTELDAFRADLQSQGDKDIKGKSASLEAEAKALEVQVEANKLGLT